MDPHKIHCRRCGKLKPFQDVTTRFTVFSHPGVVQMRFRMCGDCRIENRRAISQRYRENHKERNHAD